ncbi:MAG TPA: VIT domain-containing protein [Phycisphaerae bacterium]|nr:VIT domain-containing protein [Phycisphaerae bacterium]
MRSGFWIMVAVVVGVLMGLSGRARGDGFIVIPDNHVVVRGHFIFAPLEVTYHRVECRIDDQVAVTSVDQEFFNPNDSRLEGDYMFPVPEGARIDKFAMDIDGKTVEAELLPADKARGIYEDIVRRTRDPALLEYAGRAMFRVHIFPIEPHSRKKIQLKYTELLKQDNGLLDYHYTLNTEKYSSAPLKDVSIHVTVGGTTPITTVYSPTHTVDVVHHGDNEAVVSYEAHDVRPDTDFHLYIGHKAAAVGISVLSYRPDPSKEGYFVLLASPGVTKDATPMPKDVVFVMDTSGSMSGEKIEQTRKALKYCIDTLNAQDRFDVVRFSTEAEPLFNGLKDASADNRKKAEDFAANLRAAGGTAIDEALTKALAEVSGAGTDRVRMIVFMTDGQPTIGEEDPDRILAHVKPEAAGVRIFSFGVGTDVNTKLLDLVASDSRGYSQYVYPNENLELAMSNFWGKVQDPVLAGLKLDTGNVTVSKLYPKELPDLFRGDQLVAFGTYEKGGKTAVTITGMVNGKEQKFSQDVEFADSTGPEKDWIAKLWATRRVGYLLDEIRLHGESAEVKEEVVDLARRWGVVTPYTAMLIIEDEQKRRVPLAQQTLREMSQDRDATANAGAAFKSLQAGNSTGGQAVADSVNTRSYERAGNLEDSRQAAAQSSAHARFENQAAPALSVAGGGGFGGYGGRGGGGGAGRAAASPEALNLGTASANGWQGAAGPGATGYRIVTNYSQESRVVNDRSFFLNGNQWTDAGVQKLKDAKHVKIVFGSDDYFALLKRYPEAAAYFALGNNLTLALDGTVYDIVDDGGNK